MSLKIGETSNTPAALPGISKIWAFFKSSYNDRPNSQHGSGLTAFKEEWGQLSEVDKSQIRAGIENSSLTY